ncbi:hypothetical protein Leryth_000461 [Lithospermum erythrorhizon]|nr:hypothetical protein Leryth_000461 [Lithospermum erythrorhizon]
MCSNFSDVLGYIITSLSTSGSGIAILLSLTIIMLIATVSASMRLLVESSRSVSSFLLDKP